jgi:hypothetical protein
MSDLIPIDFRNLIDEVLQLTAIGNPFAHVRFPRLRHIELALALAVGEHQVYGTMLAATRAATARLPTRPAAFQQGSPDDASRCDNLRKLGPKVMVIRRHVASMMLPTF